MAAAVADFRPREAADGKLVARGLRRYEPRARGDRGRARRPRRQAPDGSDPVGFAAEHGGDFVARARGKLERKGLDAIVVNDVSDPAIGFDSADNEVTIVERDSASCEVPAAPRTRSRRQFSTRSQALRAQQTVRPDSADC